MSISGFDKFDDLTYPEKSAVDQICDAFEAELIAGKRPQASAFLESADRAIWPVLIRELLAIDVAHRHESPNVIRAEYQHSFPSLRDALEASAFRDVALESGAIIGDYRVESQIGAGGMGIVYEAHDTKLGRQVALKFLTSEFSQDRQRLERFQCEAKILAGLNHPNIATLYAFEEYENQPYCVLELVPGLTLSEMLRRRRLPVDEAIAIFLQIADALESAHESGVIHRDLKPANVKVTEAGLVKVLDFGLATSMSLVGTRGLSAVDPSGVRRESIGDHEPATSRFPHSAATTIAGTIPYMSPEQLRGKSVDKRSDIWSFGCCLYEAVAGQRAFASRATDDVMESIHQAAPDWNRLPSATPPQFVRLIRRCIEKDPRQRLRDIGDVRLELHDCQHEQSNTSTAAFRHRRIWAGFLLLAALAASILVGMAIRPLIPANDRAKVESRTSVNLPTGLQLSNEPNGHALALSPDGSQLAIAAVGEDGLSNLYLRDKARFELRRLADTEGANYPFFSPDGRRVGFFAKDRLKTIDVAGGASTTVCRAKVPFMGGCWASGDRIVFSSCWGGIVEEVSPDGRLRKKLGSVSGRFPQLLRDGKILMFEDGRMLVPPQREVPGGKAFESSEFSRPSPNADFVRHLPTGHLIYAAHGSLYSLPFHPDRPQSTEDAQLLAETNYDSLDFAVSAAGDIAFARGGSVKGELVWIDRKSRRATVAWPGIRHYGSFRISPDGNKLAIGIREDDGWSLKIFDLSTGVTSLLTNEGQSQRPVWTPDGKRVIFRWQHQGGTGLYCMEPGSQRAPELLPLIESNSDGWDQCTAASTFASDNQFGVIYYFDSRGVNSLPNLSDIFEFDFATMATRPLANSLEEEAYGQVSPDGKWLLHTSTRGTRNYEAFISSYPKLDETYRVSRSGALDPMWDPSGKTVYYRDGTAYDKIVAATIEFNPFRVVKIETVVSGTMDCPGYSFDYDPSNDRFLAIHPAANAPIRNQIHWLQNSLR